MAKVFSICKIIAESEDDRKILYNYLGNYPVDILNTYPEDGFIDMPVLIIGWNSVKHRFSKQNILDKEIKQNLYWAYSSKEDEKKFYKTIEEFFADSVKEWLPKKFDIFDSIFYNEDLISYFEKIIDKSHPVFAYFYDGALYLRNSNRDYIVNVKALSVTEKDVKKKLTDFFNHFQCIVFNYDNIYNYVKHDELSDIVSIENLRWVKYGVDTSENYFNIIPGFNIQKFIPFLMSKLKPIELDEEEKVFLRRMCQRDKITCWMSNREIAFSNKFDNNNLEFKLRRFHKLAKIQYSNKRTLTGRITAFDYYNPQNLSKDGDDRANIISRFKGGKILVFDYTSFETKIALYLCGDEEFMNKFSEKDLHYETAKIIFDTYQINYQQRETSKLLNHALLYGAGHETLLSKLEGVPNPEEKLYKVKQFLAPLIKKSEELKEYYDSRGYITTPWGSIIRIEKRHASFNNFIQSYAAELVAEKVMLIREYLKTKQSQFLFQVHDSLVLDMHPDEKEIITDIYKFLRVQDSMVLGVTYRLGNNYKELGQHNKISAEKV